MRMKAYCFGKWILNYVLGSLMLFLLVLPQLSTVILDTCLFTSRSCSNSSEITQSHRSSKTLCSIVAAFGACMAFFDILMLLINAQSILFHEWLYAFSQFSVWVSLNLLISIQNPERPQVCVSCSEESSF